MILGAKGIKRGGISSKASPLTQRMTNSSMPMTLPVPLSHFDTTLGAIFIGEQSPLLLALAVEAFS